MADTGVLRGKAAEIKKNMSDNILNSTGEKMAESSVAEEEKAPKIPESKNSVTPQDTGPGGYEKGLEPWQMALEEFKEREKGYPIEDPDIPSKHSYTRSVNKKLGLRNNYLAEKRAEKTNLLLRTSLMDYLVYRKTQEQEAGNPKASISSIIEDAFFEKMMKDDDFWTWEEEEEKNYQETHKQKRKSSKNRT